MVSYALGLDYGTDSVRALLVETTSGEEVATYTVNYPRWAKGLYCEPRKDQFRQHPLDYLESLELVMQHLWQVAPADAADHVVGISFDTTGSTPIALDADGVALALKPQFAENPNAMFVLWKDHTAITEAAEITAAAEASTPNYLAYEGGIYSSEWYWAKVLHVSRQDTEVHKAAHMWVEHCDWMAAVLTDTTAPKSFAMGRCAAGHKLMWHQNWNGYPPNSFFMSIDPLLDGLTERLPQNTYTSDQAVGHLTAEWAAKLGLAEGIPVGFSAFDCHMGAVAANVKPGVLTKIMGTSTCDITVVQATDLGDVCVKGICGQVDGSVIPGLIGLEAGQSAFGDLYAWYKNLLAWPTQALADIGSLDSETLIQLEAKTLTMLSEAAAELSPLDTSVIALDWINGRRTPDADQKVGMAIQGLKMGTSAPEIFRALVEATAFGARAIIERFREEGVSVESVVAIGGISKKSEFVMQTCADVWNCPIDVLESDQSCALGAAIFASVVGGAHPNVPAAQKAMASKVNKTYTPNSEMAAIYATQYPQYQALASYVNGVAAP